MDISPWIFPVNVKTIELVISQKVNSFINELIHSEYVRCKFFEWSRSKCPPTDSQKNL